MCLEKLWHKSNVKEWIDDVNDVSNIQIKQLAQQIKLAIEQKRKILKKNKMMKQDNGMGQKPYHTQDHKFGIWYQRK